MKYWLHLVVVVPLLVVQAACREPNTPAGEEPDASNAVELKTTAPTASLTAAIPVDVESRKMGTLCNLEFVDGKPFTAGVASAAPGAVIRGWLADDSGTTPAVPMLVVQRQSADVAINIPIILNMARSDVALAFPAMPGLENSGFEASLQRASLGPGKYHLYLTYSIGAEGRFCDNGRQILVPAG